MTLRNFPCRPRPLAAIWLLAAACFTLLCISARLTAQDAAQGSSDHMFRSVTVVVDYGQDVEKRWSLLRWTPDMTALDAMALAAAKPAPLGLQYEAVGSGERTFVKSIDGLINEGGRPGDRNWLYTINGEKARRSCGVATLASGDVVTWRYTPMGQAADQ